MTGKTISSWVPEETADKLDRYANKIGMSRSDTIRVLLERQLKKVRLYEVRDGRCTGYLREVQDCH